MGQVVDIASQVMVEADKSASAAAVLGALTPGEIIPLGALCVRYVRATVAVCGGNKSQAARALGLTRRTLYRWLEREAA